MAEEEIFNELMTKDEVFIDELNGPENLEHEIAPDSSLQFLEQLYNDLI